MLLNFLNMNSKLIMTSAINSQSAAEPAKVVVSMDRELKGIAKKLALGMDVDVKLLKRILHIVTVCKTANFQFFNFMHQLRWKPLKRWLNDAQSSLALQITFKIIHTAS
jgi:hypothetical protein